MSEAIDNTLANWINARGKNNRNIAWFLPKYLRLDRGSCENHVWREFDQLCRVGTHTVGVTRVYARFDVNIATFNPSQSSATWLVE